MKDFLIITIAMKLKCLIVDDEPIARTVLKNHAAKLEVIQIVGECSNAIEATNFLASQEIDLLFLDIEMPEMSGLAFLKTGKFDFDVVLTTAYAEYGVESYQFEVSDYLLKPIPFERFNECIQKIVRKKRRQSHNNHEEEAIFLKSDKKTFRFPLDQILFFQGYGNYLKIFTKNEKQPTLILEKISALEKKLAVHDFQRTHKSFLVNIKNIEILEGNTLHLYGNEVPVSQTHKTDLLERMNLL